MSNTVLLGEASYAAFESMGEPSGVGKFISAPSALCAAIGLQGWSDTYFALPAVNTTKIRPVANRLFVGDWVASSYHRGGVYFALFDGSVRFVSENTDVETLWAVSTLDEGEVVADW